MTQRCECEHWQQCPTCTPDGFDAAGNRKPPEPTARQACSAELDEWRIADDAGSSNAALGAIRLLDPGVVEIDLHGVAFDATGWRQLGEAVTRIVEGEQS